jgi:2-keto-4-pentenoate hydratase
MNRDDERIIRGMVRQRERRPEGATRVGWKSAFGTRGGMEFLGIDQPLAGHLTEVTRLESGSTVDASGWDVPLIEAEVAVRIDSDLDPSAGPEEAGAAVGAVAPAIELIDLGSTDDVAEVIAGNIFHRHFLLGEFVTCDGIGLDGVRLAVTANGSASEPSDPRQVVGDLRVVVAAIADQAELAGDRVRAGDVIITGAAVPPAPFGSGDRFEVELTGGGRVSVRAA